MEDSRLPSMKAPMKVDQRDIGSKSGWGALPDKERKQAMQQIGAPLPIEEVGQGARWTYTTKLNQGGVRLKQVASYKLISLEGNKLVLKAKVKQRAPKQKLAAPGGVKVELLKLKSDGAGNTTMTLDQLAPSASKMKLKSTMTMGAGKNKRMSVITGMIIDISSR